MEIEGTADIHINVEERTVKFDGGGDYTTVQSDVRCPIGAKGYYEVTILESDAVEYESPQPPDDVAGEALVQWCKEQILEYAKSDSQTTLWLPSTLSNEQRRALHNYLNDDEVEQFNLHHHS